MPYPINKWDLVPVYGVYMTAPGDTPVAGTVRFTLSQRVTRTDGRTIYPEGARVQVTIGAADQQDASVRAAVRSAWRAADQTAQGVGFDGAAWDVWWDTIVLPAAVFTGFPASDDPDISQRGWTVGVEEALTGASGRKYAIQPLLAQLETPIPGVNLGMVDVPPGSPTVPAPVYAKGVAGGIAALDADGDVVDAAGEKVAGGLPEDATLADLAESTTVKYFTASEKTKLSGVATGATANDTDTNLKARANHTGSQAISTVTGLQTALDAKATTAQGAKADTAVQPAAISALVPNTRTIAGKALTADVSLVKADVGLGSVDNTSDTSKPVSTAQAAAIALKADDSAVVKMTGAQSVAGVKTFSSAPVVPDASFAIAKTTGLQTALDAKATTASVTAKVGSPNSTITGIAYYPTVGDLPGTGTAGVIYFVDAE